MGIPAAAQRMSVQLEIVAGRNLAPKDKTGKSDPYVVAKIFGMKKAVKKKKTSVVKQNLNPVWNEKLQFDVVNVRVEALHLTCFDKDMFGSEFMGQVTITLKEIATKNNQLDDWFTLDTNHKGETVSGDIHVRATLKPPAGQENLFSAPAAAEVEDTLSGEELAKVLAQEDAFNAGKKTVGDIYKVGKELGRGAFAVVKEATHKESGRKNAVKIIDRGAMGDTNELSLQREIEIMQKVDHPNIIALRQVFEDKKHVYLVMELVTGGELFDKIVEKGNYTESDAADLTRAIVEAIGYLHKLDIAHRDLKPENLLLKHKGTSTEVKIADFGLSRMVNEAAMMKTACGTPTYVAPEVLTNTGYGPGVDMWSIGVITYILLCGFPPFYGDSIPLLFEQILKGSYDYPVDYWEDVSDEAIDFIDHLLVVDRKTRYTAKQALEHPWLSGEKSDKPLKIGEAMSKMVITHRSKSAKFAG